MDYRCIFCQTRAFEKKLKELPVANEIKEFLAKEFFNIVCNLDEHTLAPDLASDTYKLIREVTRIADPCKKEKRVMNNYLLELYPGFKSEIKSSVNPFNKALRLAIAGNIIDTIASPDYDINHTINHVLSSDFKIDHSTLLLDEIQKAKTILYLGDNAGEIVMDKLFIKTINHPNLYFAVRGFPVINDATMEDAKLVGMHDVAKVISNGSDAPSTIIDKTSAEFLEIYHKADLVISKGQGNFEGLINEKSKNIFFLFMVKCDVIGNMIGANEGDFVVTNNLTVKKQKLTLAN